MTERTRAAGALVGLACGDALGRPVEFRSSDAVAREHGRVTEMHSNGTHGRPAGTVTDDTDLALRVARSLVAHEGFDADDVARRFSAWLASDPFDVGLLTADAIGRFDAGRDPLAAGRAAWEDRREGQNAGNGSLMRCAPTALAYADRTAMAEAAAAESAITHADPRCVESCVACCRVVRELIEGAPGERALSTALSQARARDAPDGVRERLAVAAEPEARRRNGGFVLDTLETALTDALTAESFEAAVVESVSRGGDADTVGAVCGAVAGARFGLDAVPTDWSERVAETAELRDLAADLAALARR